MNNKIEFIADDFGRDEDTNNAMVHAYKEGVLTGAALMFGQPGTDHAIELAKANPGLNIGWHFHIADSKPLSLDEWPWSSPVVAGFSIGFSRRAKQIVNEEVKLQWHAMKESGLKCHFINAHHHMCIHPHIRKTITKTVKNEFSGWMRWGRPKFFGEEKSGYKILDSLLQKPHIKKFPFKTSTTLWGIDRTFQMKSDEVLKQIKLITEQAGDDEIHEFMFHPRKIGDQDTNCLIAIKEKSTTGFAVVD